ncbi:hypothetical protein TEA_025207 [Camellia sinensis var. sinensis]|uniref:Autophagy-related protein n=2 Tax=Camellia sinensis TaxID=4442 RepID=A0A4S4EFW5_CAMSN|nr:hypothetical protein TEA_025207 [Camellia sinensis var. sinensis]
MANDGQKEKVGDDTLTESGKHIDLDVEEDNCNAKTRDKNHKGKDVGQEGGVPKKSDRSGYYNEGDLQVWKDRCLRRDDEMKGMTDKLVDLQMVINFMMQNNIMQPPFPLQDMPIPEAKKDTQEEGQNTVPAVPYGIGLSCSGNGGCMMLFCIMKLTTVCRSANLSAIRIISPFPFPGGRPHYNTRSDPISSVRHPPSRYLFLRDSYHESLRCSCLLQHQAFEARMTKIYFKQEHDFEKRRAEAARIREKYSDRIPVIVEKAERSDIPNIDKKKYLVPADLTVGQFVYVIRKRIKLSAEKAIFIFVDNILPPTGAIMSTIYDEKKDEDGFLYVTYSGENTFG